MVENDKFSKVSALMCLWYKLKQPLFNWQSGYEVAKLLSASVRKASDGVLKRDTLAQLRKYSHSHTQIYLKLFCLIIAMAFPPSIFYILGRCHLGRTNETSIKRETLQSQWLLTSRTWNDTVWNCRAHLPLIYFPSSPLYLPYTISHAM